MEWSLHKVLHYLSFEGVDISTTLSLHRAVFLLALATGNRSSQLAALTCHPSYTCWAPDTSSVMVTPSPAVIAKNEQADALISPLRIPAFLEEGHPHPHCSVQVLADYVEHTEGVSADNLFYNPKTQTPLTPRTRA